MELVTREVSLQFAGLSFRNLDWPIQQTSHFSILALREEDVQKVFIIFQILLMDCLSRTKKVLSSANAVSLISISPILNPLIALSFLI